MPRQVTWTRTKWPLLVSLVTGCAAMTGPFGQFLSAAGLPDATDSKSARKAKMSTAPLRFHLTARDFYTAGGPVAIDFRIENASAKAVWVLKWNTPLEGIQGRILRVTCDGSELEYQGRMIKRGKPESQDFVLVQPGSATNAQFDLSQVYNLSPSTECEIAFKGRVCFRAAEQGEPSAVEDLECIIIPGNSAAFRIKK